MEGVVLFTDEGRVVDSVLEDGFDVLNEMS